MTIEQFKTFRDAAPFSPFAMHLADGRSIRVSHPEIAILSRSGRTVTVVNDDQLPEVVDMLLVISLRPLSDLERRIGRSVRR